MKLLQTKFLGVLLLCSSATFAQSLEKIQPPPPPPPPSLAVPKPPLPPPPPVNAELNEIIAPPLPPTPPSPPRESVDSVKL